MMSIINGYSECSKNDIMKMAEDELRAAIIRVFSVKTRDFAPDDSWVGQFILEDDIADAFRGRV